MCVAGVDDTLDGGGHQQVDVDLEQIGVADLPGSREAEHRAGAIQVFFQRGHVKTAHRGYAAVLVGDGHHAHARVVEETGRVPAHLAEPLHGGGGRLGADAPRRQRGQRHVHHAARGGGAAAQRATKGDRLSGAHAQYGVAALHRVGVHQPRHGLLVGADVGRGDIVFGTDQRADLTGVAAGHALELGGAVLTRVDADAALGPAVRNVEQRAFPRHPHGQRPDLVERRRRA